MENSRELKFESPSFITRIKGMLGVDFYRLFHTPLFYIFLGMKYKYIFCGQGKAG